MDRYTDESKFYHLRAKIAPNIISFLHNKRQRERVLENVGGCVCVNQNSTLVCNEGTKKRKSIDRRFIYRI